MSMARSSNHLAAPLLMKSQVPSVDCSTGTNCPGHLVPWPGVASSLHGDASVVGLLLICLFAAALLTPFEELMLQGKSGRKSSLSTNTGSRQKKDSGGTEKEQYDAK